MKEKANGKEKAITPFWKLQEKRTKKANINICYKCHYRWNSKSRMKMITCPNCSRKIINIKESEVDQADQKGVKE